MMRKTCISCGLDYPPSLIRRDGVCLHCFLAQERIRSAAQTAAEYIKTHGREAWDAELAVEQRELN